MLSLSVGADMQLREFITILGGAVAAVCFTNRPRRFIAAQPLSAVWRCVLRLVPLTESEQFTSGVRFYANLGACPNSHCSILSESDSSLGYEQVFSSLEYRSDAASAAECAGLCAERPCLAVYR